MNLAQRIASYLQLSPDFVEKLALSASHRYKEYRIPKKGGGSRTIHHPAKQLKVIQRCLLRQVIEALPVHDCASAYRKGKNIAVHARTHVQSSFLLRMDIKDFFPSITADDIDIYITQNPRFFPSWNSEDIKLFCQLVCRNDQLTIGAPTSPELSNALCYGLDILLAGLALENDAVYTRYADDLFFSTRTPNLLKNIEVRVAEIVEKSKCPANLRINRAKTRHSSKRRRRQVTGIVLGSDGRVYFGRRLKRWIRSLIHNIDNLEPRERAHLAGMLAFCKDIEPDFINALILKYGTDKVDQARKSLTDHE